MTSVSRPRAARARLAGRVGGDTGLGYLAVATVVLLWGCGPLFVRAVDASPLTISFWRNLVGIPVLVLSARLAGAPLTWRRLRNAVPAGLLFAAAQALAFASFQETSLANAALISALSPVVIVIAAVPLFGERLTGGQVALMAITMAAVGVFLFAAGDTSGASRTGDLLACGSLFAMSGYLLVMKHRSNAGEPAVAFISGVFIVGAVVLAPLAAIWGTSVTALSVTDWVWVLLLALAAGCLGHAMMTWAQRHVEVGMASVMILATTVVTAVGAWIFFDQPLNGVQIAAGVVVLATIAGVLVLQLRRHPGETVLPDLAEPPFAE